MIKGVYGAISWITLRNDMLDLSISFINVDFTICAKPMLNIHQGFNEFRVRASARMIAEPVPIFDPFIFFSKVSVETGRRVFQ